METEKTPRRVVREGYTSFLPPVNVAACVSRLLDGAPESALMGLGSVNLRDTGGLSRRENAKNRQRRVRSLLGCYYPRSASRPAGIDLFVDVILEGWPLSLVRVPLVLDMAIGKVLFHELGHHLDARTARGIRSREGAAEAWSKKLLRRYVRRRYWFLIPFRPLFVLAGWLFRSLRRRGG